MIHQALWSFSNVSRAFTDALLLIPLNNLQVGTSQSSEGLKVGEFKGLTQATQRNQWQLPGESGLTSLGTLQFSHALYNPLPWSFIPATHVTSDLHVSQSNGPTDTSVPHFAFPIALELMTLCTKTFSSSQLLCHLTALVCFMLLRSFLIH